MSKQPQPPEPPSAGYYSLTLKKASGKYLLRSNNERAFIVTRLQDLLGRRSLLEEPHARYQLASHIDLLAFSILNETISLVVFSIAETSARTFIELISLRLEEYQREWHLAPAFLTTMHDSPKITITRLAGPFAALNKSVSLHLRHPDWEYDRYSSIGFYLHDRRGDWMHVWRMSKLYENDSETYRQLVIKQRQINNPGIYSTAQPFEPLWHAL